MPRCPLLARELSAQTWAVPLARAADNPCNNAFGVLCLTLAESTCDSVTVR
jgi:hypothetical protein